MSLLPLLCVADRAETRLSSLSTNAIIQARRLQETSKHSRSVRNLRFRCVVAPNDPTNQTFNVAIDYYNQGHAVVWVKFRLGVQLDNSALLYYVAADDQPLEPGKTQRYAVSVIKEEPAHRVEERVPGSIVQSLVECKVDQVTICPAGVSVGVDNNAPSNSSKESHCTPEPSFTEKFKVPPDKKWNCFDIDDGGRRCETVVRPHESCLATVCMGDMVWVTTSRQWFAFDGEDWLSCRSDDPNLDPQGLWSKCADLIRKKQTEFTPGEFVPLPKAGDVPALERE